MSCRWRENVAHTCHVAVNSRSQNVTKPGSFIHTTSQLSTLCGLFHILFVLFVSPTFLLMLHHFPLSNQITYNFLKKASRYEFADKIRSTSWGHVGQRSLHTSGTGSKLIGLPEVTLLTRSAYSPLRLRADFRQGTYTCHRS